MNMKKIIFTLAVLLIAMPAMATVTITCEEESPDSNGWVTISYDDGGGEPVRGFALDISTGNDAKIIDINDNVNYDYTIFPGSIQIDASGNVTDYGTAVGDYPIGTCAGLDSNCITIEMVSLYVGANTPPDSGDLLRLQVDGNCSLSITGNALRGSVVLEDISEAAIDAPGCGVAQPPECMKTSHPDYVEWGNVGSPDCWCYPRQCKGDVDCTQEYGVYWVFLLDLNDFSDCFGIPGIPRFPDDPCICYDIDHNEEYGAYRVFLADLDIFKFTFGNMSVHCCDDDEDCDLTDGDTRFNFWTCPP